MGNGQISRNNNYCAMNNRSELNADFFETSEFTRCAILCMQIVVIGVELF